MIVIPASLRSDFIHMAGMTIHIALESTIHIAGIRIVLNTPQNHLSSHPKCHPGTQDGRLARLNCAFRRVRTA